jgi:competence protein ComEA
MPAGRPTGPPIPESGPDRIGDPTADPTPDPEFWGEDPRPRAPIRPLPRAGRRHRDPGAFDGLVDRVRVWREDPKFAVAALIALALVAGFVWYRIGVGTGEASEGEEPTAETVDAAGAAPDPSPTTASTTVAAGDVTVHVAGAVLRPGVVELPPASRVIDALEAAGGGVPEADLDRLNLAAPVADGEQILVQKVGDPIAPTPSGAAGAGDGAASGPVNVNTADLATLETLPGVGPVLAQAIIDEREERGGFRSVNELRDVRGIGDARFADLEGLVTV